MWKLAKISRIIFKLKREKLGKIRLSRLAIFSGIYYNRDEVNDMAGVTAKDIAKKLGISTASVSVALNNKPGVSRETRARVLEAARAMGYAPPRAAEGQTICFVIYLDEAVGIAQESNFYTFVLQGVEAAAKELGYRVLIRYFYASLDFSEQLEDILPDLAGMIVLGTDFTAARRREIAGLIDAALPFPVVVADSFVCSAYVDCVGNDNLYGAKSAMSYLIDQGHRRFCYLRARQRIANFDDREHGIRMALSEHLGEAGSLTTLEVDIAAEGAYRELLEKMDHRNLPDAFFAENDVVAAAAIRALRALGVQVPEAVSVMGFDDIPVCELVEPALTTVHAFKETLGAEAMGLLHRRIARGQTIRDAQATGLIKLSLSTRIVPRRSVAPPGMVK